MATHRHRPLAHTALARAAGTTEPSAVQVTSGFNDLCAALTGELHPLFGATASDTLFARAVDLASKDFPWLAALSLKGSGHCSIDTLAALDGTVTAKDLHDGLTAVLAYNIDLLVAFVGDDLVVPLVRKAWPAIAAELDGD